MSLLYEALLKNNKNKSASETDADKPANAASLNSASMNNVEHSEFLTSSSNVNKAQGNQFSTNKFANASNGLQQGGKHIPSSVWIFIGSLLLIVGLLAGYIYGNTLLANNKTATQIPELINTTENSNELIIKEPEPISGTITIVPDNESTNENDDKTVEIALDSAGQVISKVSQLTAYEDEQANLQSKREPVKTKIPDTSETLEQDIAEPVVSNDQISLNDVPDKLKASFAEAIKATERQKISDESFEMDLLQSPDLLMLDDLTPYQLKSLPDLIYQMHIFSSDVSERWIRINGITLYEGNELQQGLTLLEIKQDLIVWRFNSIKVGQVALVDFIK